MGPAWRNQNMSMRNPMSRAPMNNNPMGNQAPMQPTYAPGVSFQQAARNVTMQQPPGANTSMRPLNMPGMQFDASRNAMVRQQRPQLTVNPNPERWGNLSAPSSTGGMIDPATQRMNTRIARAGRMAGVRPGDMAQWRQQSPTAIAMRNAPANAMVKAGPPGGQPAQMGAQMGPVQPQAIQAAMVQSPSQQAEVSPRIQAIQQQTDRQIRPIMNMPEGAPPLVTSNPLQTMSQPVVGNDEYYGNNAIERWWIKNIYGRQQPQSYQPQQWRNR